MLFLQRQVVVLTSQSSPPAAYSHFAERRRYVDTLDEPPA
jgi:hypothetical protein